MYVGNLSFFTNEQQIHGYFSMVGDVVRVIMDLNKARRSRAGLLHRVRDAPRSCRSQARAGWQRGRVIKVEMDPGFVEGRQYGRGNTGGQVRDEMRAGFDGARGGENGGLIKSSSMAAGQPTRASRRLRGRGRGNFRGDFRGDFAADIEADFAEAADTTTGVTGRCTAEGGGERGIKRTRDDYNRDRPREENAEPQVSEEERDDDDESRRALHSIYLYIY